MESGDLACDLDIYVSGDLTLRSPNSHAPQASPRFARKLDDVDERRRAGGEPLAKL